MPQEIYSKKEFSRQLERERVRADRTGCIFSILIIEISALQKHNHNVHTLCCKLRNRVRCYDIIGWVSKTSLAMLLPDTDERGASALLQNISTTMLPKGAPVSHKVVTYPSHWPSGNGKNSRTNAREGHPPPDAANRSGNDQAPSASLDSVMPRQIPSWKRAVDVCGALCGLLLLAPVFLAIALFIKMVSPGPILFKQKRMGFMGKTFYCLKFRTMKINAETALHTNHVVNVINNDKPLYKLDARDTRIIPFGKVLRKTGLDELPQLINVLRGEMSLIGPRPCIPYEADQYKPWQRKRFDTVPGITGLWQVNGKNRTTFNEMMRYDIRYTTRKNLFLDLQILAKTLPAIISQFTRERP